MWAAAARQRGGGSGHGARDRKSRPQLRSGSADRSPPRLCPARVEWRKQRRVRTHRRCDFKVTRAVRVRGDFHRQLEAGLVPASQGAGAQLRATTLGTHCGKRPGDARGARGTCTWNGREEWGGSALCAGRPHLAERALNFLQKSMRFTPTYGAGGRRGFGRRWCTGRSRRRGARPINSARQPFLASRRIAVPTLPAGRRQRFHDCALRVRCSLVQVCATGRDARLSERRAHRWCGAGPSGWHTHAEHLHNLPRGHGASAQRALAHRSRAPASRPPPVAFCLHPRLGLLPTARAPARGSFDWVQSPATGVQPSTSARTPSASLWPSS